jgi:predicted metal-dependent peptidase
MSLEMDLLNDLEEIRKTHREWEPIIDRVRLVLDEKKDVTMWMDHSVRMGYNPAWVRKLSSSERRAVVLHEISHYSYGHFIRIRQFSKVYGRVQKDIFNVAADLEINSDIKGLPPDGCFPQSFNYPPKLSMEEYYIRLCKGGVKVEGLGKSLTNDIIFGDDENELITGELIQEEVLMEVEEASKKAGKTTFFGKGLTKIKVVPPINIYQYIKVLYARMQDSPQFGFDHTNYGRFKRSIIPDIVKFRQNDYNPQIKLAFVVDTSGSRSNGMINEGLSRIYHTLKSLGENKTISDLYTVDAEVKQSTRLNSENDIPKEFHGRGGTRMDAVFEKMKEKYDLVVFMTDGQLNNEDLSDIPSIYKKKVVLGIDKQYFKDYQNIHKFPLFIL